eukprot:5059180-Alexandrium_andersonii.AAC.1
MPSPLQPPPPPPPEQQPEFLALGSRILTLQQHGPQWQHAIQALSSVQAEFVHRQPAPPTPARSPMQALNECERDIADLAEAITDDDRKLASLQQQAIEVSQHRAGPLQQLQQLRQQRHSLREEILR